MRLTLQIATLILIIYLGVVAHKLYRMVDSIEFYSEKQLKAEERCEGSMHQYLDELVPNKGGILDEQKTEVLETPAVYAPLLDETTYP